MFVIASVFVELLANSGVYVFGDKLHEIDGSRIAEAQQTAADAEIKAARVEKEAAEALGRAEKSEAARLAMLDQLKPRDLTKTQVKEIADALRGHFKEITVARLADPDAIGFANAISEAIRQSGAAPMILFDNSKGPNRWLWTEWNVPASLTGVTVYASKDDMPLFLEALMKENTGGLIGEYAPNEQFSQVPIPTIFVGLKPEPFWQFPSYLAPPFLENWQKEHPPPWSPK